ncbi:MAG: 16S rRNA (cytosine(967)-C(5))-methyltransferase RsmB [Ignavibacteria bacterium]|nr:16S rRNA (cytosine(967)-C(5))-methyltransferase RsmB [Ignavibacteria bacterium]
MIGEERRGENVSVEPTAAPGISTTENLYKGPRGTAVKVLNRIERSDAYLDRLIDHEMRSTDMNELDKGLMNEIVTGVIRWRMKVDWILTGFFHGSFTKAETNIRNALRVALYQILFLDRVPHSAAVNEAVEFTKRLRGQKVANQVNAILRNIIRSIDNIRYPDINEDKIQHLAVVESHPLWMVRRWVDRFGYDETKRLLDANNRIPDLTLRVNRLKIDFNLFLKKLGEHQIEHIRSPYLDWFVRVKHMAGIGASEMFREGFFVVQDESAGLPVRLLNPQQGERVIDLCAAPGGKTTYIGELLHNIGEIVAIDKYETRLNMVRSACQRLGIVNVQFLTADAQEVNVALGDKVLVDVPCSGLGVLSKKPDAKWKREQEDLLRLADTQRQILNHAATLVRDGGVLVYSTCTVEPEENSDIIRDFLAQHTGFTIENAAALVHTDLVQGDGIVATYPHVHGMDGSFAVRMRKNSSP